MNRLRLLPWLAVPALALALALPAPRADASGRLQVPTNPIPTVTGTPGGPNVLAVEQVNVRSGPSVEYERVGVLVPGQRAPAIGRSPGGDWIQIVYPGAPGSVGWVYTFNVNLEAGASLLRIVEPPPTVTPRVTATIDPTLAAQFPSLGQPASTRLPTYTPAAPAVQVTFAPNPGVGGGFPPIIAILGLLVVGVIGSVISRLQGR
jgi:hypothetical protein